MSGEYKPKSEFISEDSFNEVEEDVSIAGFDPPELEFDEYGMDLGGNGEVYYDDDDEFGNFCQGRMTPDGLIEDDFEEELGCAAQELSVQEVIDSDFPEISRLGILQVAGDDKLGRKVIVFSACRLPFIEQINHQRLLEYIKKTLEQYVTNDYALVYFHYGFSSRNKPSMKWMLQAYKDFDRNFKKNLKALHLVHPSGFIKFMWNLFRPVISAKFGRKVMYVNQLMELDDHFYIDQLPIPQRVKDYDTDIMMRKFNIQEFENNKPTHSSKTTFMRSSISKEISKTQQFEVPLSYILAHNGGGSLPFVIQKTVTYLQIFGLEVEGIFLRSVSPDTVKRVKEKFDKGEDVNFEDYGDPHVPAVILKIFLRQLTEPLLTFELYDEIVKIHNLPPKNKIIAIKRMIMDYLPDENYEVLNYLITFLTEVAAHSSQNHMTAISLGVVFGANLIWSKQLVSLTTMSFINNFVQHLITNYDDIFVK